jgi:hypothetical protein
MSAAPALAPLTCAICGHPLTRFMDAERVRERGKPTGAVRCHDYAGCMIRAARNRRVEIGAEERDAGA